MVIKIIIIKKKKTDSDGALHGQNIVITTVKPVFYKTLILVTV